VAPHLLKQAEYPFLDTSLLAALIAELPPDNPISDEALDQLRGTLHVLSLHAEQDDSELRSQLEPECGHASSSRFESDAILDSESNTPDSLSSFTSATSTSSIPAGVSNYQISTAQGFFHVLFPHLPPSLIEKTLRSQGGPDSQEDIFNEDEMCTIVDHLLNLEYIQDLTERGMEGLSDTQADVDGPRKLVTNKRNHVKSTKRPRHTVALIDIRQRQHVAHQSNINNTARVIRPKLLLDDPWTRLRSLATRASDLLPSTRPEYFISYFHTPKSELPNVRAGWKAEADALRQALTDLVARYPSKLDEVQLASSSETLSSILLSSEDETLDAEQKHRVQEDIRLCLAATKGDGDAALDLVWLLCELEEAFEIGDGIAHTLPLSKSARPSILDSSNVELPPAAPPPSHEHPPSASPTRSGETTHDGWTLVKSKKSKDPHPHAAFIPAYSNGVHRPPGKKRNGDAVQLARELNRHRREASDLRSLRAEAIREASRHWQAGNSKNHGGEVAIFYAERAREIQEEQKKWALGLARLTVEEKRFQSDERDTIDLHGLTVSEATVIVRETLGELSHARSLKVITGRGHHSAGQVGVLGPALRDMLLKEGYHVSQWDAGLLVRGKR